MGDGNENETEAGGERYKEKLSGTGRLGKRRGGRGGERRGGGMRRQQRSMVTWGGVKKE